MPYAPEVMAMLETNAKARRATISACLTLAAATALGACDRGSAQQSSATDSTTAAPAIAAAPPEVAARMAPLPAPSLAVQLADEERAELARVPAGAGHDLVIGSCLTCHSFTMIAQQHKDTAGWSKTVTQMVVWGAPVPADQKSVLVAYLAEHFPAR